jgi:hypothetical protein
MSTLLVNKIQSVTGDTVTISGSNIIVQGTTALGDASGDDHITIRGHVTASGFNISASSVQIASITASSDIKSTGPSGSLLLEGGASVISGSTISAGKGGFGNVIHAKGLQSIISGSTLKAGKGGISGSHVQGRIEGNNVRVTGLPGSDPGVSGRLFTQSGSQLPFATGSAGTTVRTLFNAFSSSKFVLISP